MLALVHYIYMCCKVSANVYLQYVYEFNERRLNYWQKSLDSIGANSSEYLLLAKQQVALDKMSSSKSKLEWIGAPFFELKMVTLVGYQFLLYLSFIDYIVGMVWYKYVFPLDFRLGRLLLYPKSESACSVRLVCDETNEFTNSSRNFAASLKRFDGYRKGESLSRSQQRPLTDRHDSGRDYLKQLRQLALDDKLRPLNRVAPWHQRLSTYFCLLSQGLIVSMALVSTIMMITMGVFFEINYRTWTWIDWLMAIENLILIYYCGILSIFYFTIIPLSCMDQTYYIDNLLCLTTECRQQIQTKTDKTPWIVNEIKSTDMNTKLLHCFIQHRIFISQFKSIKRVFQLSASCAMILWFLLPVLFLLHAPYSSSKVLTALGLLLCFDTCTVLSIMLVSICRVYSRSFLLYKSLYSLLAQIVAHSDHNHLMGADVLAPIYDPHLIKLLRKLLDDPELFMEQFASFPFGIQLNYENIIKLYFWSGAMILLAAYGVASEGQDPVFHFLSDPFGLMAV